MNIRSTWLMGALSPVGLNASALNISNLEGNYKLTKDRYGMCAETLYMRSEYRDKATGRTSVQETKLITRARGLRLIDQDIAIPATKVDCSYRKE